MTEPNETRSENTEVDSADGVSRRGMLLGIGAAAGAVAGVGLITSETHAAPAASAVPRISARPEAVSAPLAGLTYIAIDAQQMWPTIAAQRVYQDITGTQGNPNDRIWAGLPLPVGSVIKQISVGYQTQPILEISRRPITPAIPATAPEQVFQKTLAMSPGQGFSSTETMNVTIEQGYSYMLSFFLGAGSSVFNASIGYVPPTQTFLPFTGTPRVLDTRLPGPLTGKLAANEERVVDLGITGARTAVINLTVTQTGGAGYVAAFPANIAWPGNSSINWYEPNSDLANGVLVAVDPTGKIKIRGGGGADTHVVIDRIGYFL